MRYSKEVKMFETSDGGIFNTEKEAERYGMGLEIVKILNAFETHPPYFDTLDLNKKTLEDLIKLGDLAKGIKDLQI